MEQNATTLPIFSYHPYHLSSCGTHQIGEGMASILFFWAENPADYANASIALFLSIGILSIISLFFGVTTKSTSEQRAEKKDMAKWNY